MRGTKAIAALVAAVMLSSAAGVTAFADSKTAKTDDRTYNYVALGDSIAAGFGLADGDLASDPALVITDKLLNDPVKGAYPAIFTGYLEQLGKEKGVAVRGTNLASTAYRAEDIEKTIKNEGYKGEFAASILETYAGEGASDVLTPYHDLYNKYLADADLVSIQLGGNDIVMSIIPQMLENENPVLRAAGISLMFTLFGTDSETAIGAGLQVMQQDSENVTPEAFMEAAAFMYNVGNSSEALVEQSAGHVRDVVNAVKDVNGDTDIALVGMFNPYRTEEEAREMGGDISEVLGKIYAEAADTAAAGEDELTTDGEQTAAYVRDFNKEVERLKELSAALQDIKDPADLDALVEQIKSSDSMQKVNEAADRLHKVQAKQYEKMVEVLDKYSDVNELKDVIDIAKNGSDVEGLGSMADVLAKYRTSDEAQMVKAMAAEVAGPMVMQMAGRNVDPQMKLLNEKLKVIAEETGAVYVDVYGISPETDADPHPNANGHKEIADILFDTMSDIVYERMSEWDEEVTADEDFATDSESITTETEDSTDDEKQGDEGEKNAPDKQDSKSENDGSEKAANPDDRKKDNARRPSKTTDTVPDPNTEKPVPEPDDADIEELLRLIGDVDLNGRIDVTDISLTAAHVKGARRLTDDGLGNADTDSSTDINVTDVVMIAAHVKGVKALIVNDI